MKNLNLLALLVFVLAFTSCENFEIDIPTDNALANTEWQLISFVVEDESGSNETIQEMDDCELDNILIFKDNSNFVYDEGDTKCDPDDPQVEDGGIYILSDDQESLILTMDAEVIAADVLEFTAQTLKIQVDESEDPDEFSICIMTFTSAN